MAGTVSTSEKFDPTTPEAKAAVQQSFRNMDALIANVKRDLGAPCSAKEHG